MNSDLFNNNDLDNDLPKLSDNKELPIKKEIEIEKTVSISDINPNLYESNNDFEIPAKNEYKEAEPTIDEVSDPLPFSNEQTPVQPLGLTPDEFPQGELPKGLARDSKTNNNPNFAVTIGIVVLIVGLIIFGVYQALKISTNKKPSNDKLSSNTAPVVDLIKDEEIYKDKIITETKSQILIYNNESEYLYLYIDSNKKLAAAIGDSAFQASAETVGNPISNYSHVNIKTMYQTEGCTLTDRQAYILTEEGYLFSADLVKGYSDLYTELKNVQPMQGVSINLKSVVSGSSVKAFTTIVDGKTDCKTVNPYVLTAGEKSEIRRIYALEGGSLAIGDRYRGHVNSFGIDNFDYHIYADKTISKYDNRLLADSNNQNYKMAKVIYSTNLINELEANYVFISTDNNVLYSKLNDPALTKANNKMVKEVKQSEKISDDGFTTNKTVTISYQDGTEEVLSSTDTDLIIYDIQEFIDNPIN